MQSNRQPPEFPAAFDLKWWLGCLRDARIGERLLRSSQTLDSERPKNGCRLEKLKDKQSHTLTWNRLNTFASKLIFFDLCQVYLTSKMLIDMPNIHISRCLLLHLGVYCSNCFLLIIWWCRPAVSNLRVYSTKNTSLSRSTISNSWDEKLGLTHLNDASLRLIVIESGNIHSFETRSLS